MYRGRRLLVMVALVMIFITSATADVLKTRDGRVLEGKLISRSGGQVRFEVRKYGAKVLMKFSEREVLSVEKKPLSSAKEQSVGPKKPHASAVTKKPARHPSVTRKPPHRRSRKRWELKLGMLPPEPVAPPVKHYDVPTYYVIPLKGEVGRTFVARVLAESLADALERKPDVVILRINSPGGAISEAGKIVEVIRKYQGKLRIVTFADNALSAAAVVSLATKEIFIKQTGKIGAATAYKQTFFGLPAEIGEKFQSVWRATARSAAETGGHSTLLAEAMIDSRLALHVVEENGKKVIKEGIGGNMVSRPGRLLTMTGSEAVSSGLAKGLAEDYDDLRRELGFKKWTECVGLGTPLSEYWGKVIDKFDKDIKKFNERYVQAMKGAEESRPGNPKNTYLYDYKGRLTPKSRRLWHERSVMCLKYLKAAHKSVKQAISLCKKLDEMKEMVPILEKIQNGVEEQAAAVYKERNRSGVE